MHTPTASPTPIQAAPAAVLTVVATAPLLGPSRAADLQPCRVCNRTHARRMYALMTHWYGHRVGLQDDHGYFYLCPRCYALHVRPHEVKKPRT